MASAPAFEGSEEEFYKALEDQKEDRAAYAHSNFLNANEGERKFLHGGKYRKSGRKSRRHAKKSHRHSRKSRRHSKKSSKRSSRR